MGRSFIHVQVSRIYMELGIAFQKAVIELIQDGFCQFCVLSGSAHIIFVSHLEYHFVKRFFLISIADFLVVVFDTTVFAFLLGIVFSLCFIEQLMKYGCDHSGTQKIRVHDVRHTHASLLIDMGCTPLLVAERLGHERVQTTMETYSHLYPNKQTEVADQLDMMATKDDGYEKIG